MYRSNPLSEFDLIRDHFTHLGASREDVILGVGDDCALLRVPAGCELAVSIDTLVSGIHFLPAVAPEALGHKSLAVSLSDLAAMGAEPAWATLALTLPMSLPGASPSWVAAFCRGLDTLARQHRVAVVGGDTTSGPLAISIQVHGFVPPGQAVRRRGARPGDLICVSGTLGDAGLALRTILAGQDLAEDLRARLERPTPRVAAGLALRGQATAMIDCSDGLAADLGHILEASAVGADIALADLPLSPPVAAAVAAGADWSLPLASGDDYELCFTVPAAARAALPGIAQVAGCPLTVIGTIREGNDLRCSLPEGSDFHLGRTGYDHFAA
jgi:thiamine-monophosphate kinase